MITALGFEDHERALVAQMYWAAFGPILNVIMGPQQRGEAFIKDVLDPTHALYARDADGVLLGGTGFKTAKGALVGGTRRDLTNYYGLLSGLWRIALIALLQRDSENTRVLMDGVFVRDDMRGRGVGTALMDAICTEAAARGYVQVRLDVIDSNERARALYERIGFQATGTQTLGALRHIFEFKSAITMVKDV